MIANEVPGLGLVMHKNPKLGHWEGIGIIVRGPDNSFGKVFFVFDREFFAKIEQLSEFPPLIDLTLGSEWRFNHRRGTRFYFCRHRSEMVTRHDKRRGHKTVIRNIETAIDLCLWLPQGLKMWNPSAMHKLKPHTLKRNEVVTIKGLM